MCAAPAAPSAAWAEPSLLGRLRLLESRVATMCLAELRKIRHDRSELYVRAIQPALWLLIFGETFSHIRAIPASNGLPYLDFLAPGIMAQSALFISIFYGIQIVWERDFGILTKLMSTPTPRSALVTGKAFASGVRATSQLIVVIVLSVLLGVSFEWNPLRLLGAVAVIVIGSAFFACLSISIAGLALTRERLMGIGQAITMPLFFASNALYPVSVMPRGVRWLSTVNPLSYEVRALRTLLLGQPGSLLVDFAVLIGAAGAGIAVASLLLGRLVR